MQSNLQLFSQSGQFRLWAVQLDSEFSFRIIQCNTDVVEFDGIHFKQKCFHCALETFMFLYGRFKMFMNLGTG